MSAYTHGVNINKKALHFCKPFPYLYCANIKDMTKLNNSIELNKTIPFKSATFCSGIGSPEQSLKELNANHINVFACEKDKFAHQTYLANFTPGIMLNDMTTESYDDPALYADLIVAGIPCQSFSLAGKRQGEKDPRGLLIYDFIRYVKKQRPKVFIIENVKGLLSDMGGVTFGKWCEILGCSKNGQPNMFIHPESCGYNLHYRVLNAKHYGLPQNRERVFLIGIRADLPSVYVWPKRVVLRDRLIDLLEDEVDEKYYLSDDTMAKLSECGNFVNQDTQASQVHDIFGCVPAVSAGTHGYAMGYVPELKKLYHSTHEGNRIYDKATTYSGNRVRRLTPLEVMRVQGFPDIYNRTGSPTQQYKQAGNSIPVHLMKAVLKPLLNLLENP